ncbi:hypothetical protein F5884DRAFT_729915 [Xylogone sp. PMI_703]|nr:hypothetical protein F5884DRAFT_729915 [Xylogone sp. PMI_703]
MGFKEFFRSKKGKDSKPRKRGPEYRDPNVQPTLPKSRPRALTFQGSSSQQASNLFLRLPAELRNRIYLDVFGNRKVHILFSYGSFRYGYRTRTDKKPPEWRWWHCICTWDQTTDDRYWSIRWDQCKGGNFDGSPGPPNGMMGKLKLDFAILQTCRQIYSEGIDILYGTTTFDFDGRRLLSDFPSMVLPHRFALISSIETMCEFIDLGLSEIPDEEKKRYDSTWKLLASMPNLQHLIIGVAAYECRDPVAPDLQEVWLGPPTQVRKLKHFEVLVPDSYMKHFRVDPDWNFQLKPYRDLHSP